jgi:hypothetical protein
MGTSIQPTDSDQLKKIGDVRRLLSLATLRRLNQDETNVLCLKLAGHSEADIAQACQLDQAAVHGIGISKSFREALSEASYNLRVGLLESATVAASAEIDVIQKLFDKVMADDGSLSPDTYLEYAKTILAFRANLVRSLPAAGANLPERDRLEMSPKLPARILQRLGVRILPVGCDTIIDTQVVEQDPVEVVEEEPACG